MRRKYDGKRNLSLILRVCDDACCRCVVRLVDVEDEVSVSVFQCEEGKKAGIQIGFLDEDVAPDEMGDYVHWRPLFVALVLTGFDSSSQLVLCTGCVWRMRED